jgi:sec-independent protein translocase protein TatB
VFGIGGAELVLIVVVLLLFVGPDELPKVARTLGKGLTDLRRAANVAQAELQETMQELTREVDAVKRDIAAPGQDLRDVRAKIDSQLRDAAGPVPDPEPLAVIPKRKPAAADTQVEATEPDVASAVAAGDDPWVAAHRPPAALPDQPTDDVPGFSTGPQEPAAPVAATAPAFRMPTGAPIAGTVSRSATPPPAVATPAVLPPVPAPAQTATDEAPAPAEAEVEAQTAA